MVWVIDKDLESWPVTRHYAPDLRKNINLSGQVVTLWKLKYKTPLVTANIRVPKYSPPSISNQNRNDKIILVSNDLQVMLHSPVLDSLIICHCFMSVCGQWMWQKQLVHTKGVTTMQLVVDRKVTYIAPLTVIQDSFYFPVNVKIITYLYYDIDYKWNAEFKPRQINTELTMVYSNYE